jgi:hypothetical protein
MIKPMTYPQIERTSMGLALLIHLILAATIVVTFPPQSAGHQPALVFLGSILDLKEFADLTSTSAEQKPVKIDITIPILKSPVRTKSAPVDKPVYTPLLEHTQKIHLKDTFLTEPQRPPQNDESLKQLGIKTEVPPRIPLRLDSFGGTP